MDFIRPATDKDICRICEIEIFNYRLNFYPIFRNDNFYFQQLQVSAMMESYRSDEDKLSQSFVYDDGAVKGFIRIQGQQIIKLFVEPVLHGQRIGSMLVQYAITQKNASFLWALEKNTRAIAFYEKHGFHKTCDRTLEEDTDEYLIRLQR